MCPSSYQNWKSQTEGNPSKGALEFPLFTDSYITGQVVEGLGPYQLFNALPFVPANTLAPFVILRVENHLPDFDFKKPNEIKTDTNRYHGGWLHDEIAALLSLCLGIRVKAGGSTRRFEPGGDPRGVPEHYTSYNNPVSLPKSRNRLILPYACGSHCLNDAVHLHWYPDISTEEAMALVKSARIYQDAIWLSESEPALAWVMFVSSIETAADFWRKGKESPRERMRASRPQLEDLLLENTNEDFTNKVASMVADFMGATKKFIDFIMSFLPNPPKDRPVEWLQFPWDESNLSKSLRKIYDWRSRALHGGTPFPFPMCEPPHFHQGKFAEKPIGLASEAQGGVQVSRYAAGSAN